MTGQNIIGRRAERGSTSVELALVALLLFVVLIAIMDIGQFLFREQALVERARAAARWGTVTDPSNTAAIKNVVLYYKSTPPVGAIPYLGLTADMVTVSAPDAGTDHHRLVVTISGHALSLVSPFLSGRLVRAPITVSVPLGPYS
ncbi:MAG: pilus assembly protein [Candidatus Solibacter sp.]|nr:pilus assembly protein [Candidatus Solibacter sp.]